MKTREELEARAAELDYKFPSNIGDEKLAANIAVREAELANEGEGKTRPENDGDKPKKAKPAKAKHFVTVTCAVAGGRRRAGRRWDGGATKVLADELTEEMEVELEADPMFQVSVG